MLSEESHLTDQELLLAADGELPAAQAAKVAAHLSGCWPCRARKQEIEQAILDFVRLHRDHLDPLVPPAAGPRALLKARLAELAAAPGSHHSSPEFFAWKPAVAALLLVAAVLVGYHFRSSSQSARPALVTLPEHHLTPGAIATVNRDQVCESMRPKNRAVPAYLQRRVFEEYGISRPEPRAYEVDYLITPALGGSDDIRNLWPQSYSATEWNARVKDALEDHLRELVCSGRLDLATAQRDISSDWIAAYRKYFHTDEPLEPAH